MNYLRLIATYFRLGALGELEYRVNFYVQILQSALGLLVGLGGLAVVFEHTQNLGGWQPAELIILVGVFTLIGGVINLVIQPSMERFMEDVREGTLDFKLVRPEDTQLLVSVQQMRLWQLADVVLGLAVIGLGLSRLGAGLSWRHFLAFALTLLCGLAIVYSFWLILATLSFWFVRVANILVIFQTMYQAGRWPVNIYPLWLRSALTFVVPVAFAVTVPASSLVGRLEGRTLAGAVALAIAMLAGSRLFWRFGLRFYSGASA